MNYQSILETTPTPVLATGVVLAMLILMFFVVFLAPGVLHWFRLSSIQRRIKHFESENFASEFKKVFAKDKRLSHLWKEYQDSLHIQREERDGQLKPITTRATVPSELYFNSQFVVDSRLLPRYRVSLDTLLGQSNGRRCVRCDASNLEFRRRKVVGLRGRRWTL